MTAKDWADYWIHEGICTFGDELYVREFAGERAYIDQFKAMAPRFGNQIPIVMGKDIDEEAAYNEDIYGKGAFFMHTICYIMGDSLFFPAIKRLITSPQYTYDNLVNTDDIEQFFSKESGRDLKPLFDLYLRTTNKLEVHVQTMGNDKYMISLPNISIPLPMDISTENGPTRVTIGSKGLLVTSKIIPVIDVDDYYIKKIIIE
jgi:aminopeptidase N